MMQKPLWLFMFLVTIMLIAPSCNHNKIACPAYADSAPEKKSDGKKPEAPKALPKKSKSTVSHSMGPG
jgi:hypothetical protein